METGLTGVNLEAPSKLLVPLLSPFRQSIGRRAWPGKGTNHKRITAVTPSGRFFAAQGTRSNRFTLTTDDKAVNYKSYGRFGDVTWEGEIAGENYEDAKARAEALLLLKVLHEEELAIIGGNITALAQPTGGSGTAAASGGALADATYRFRVFALTMEAVARASRIARPAAGNKYNFTSVPTIDTAVGFSAASAEISATVSGGGGAGQVTLTWTAVNGAVGYAIYASTTTGAGNQKLQGIVTQTEVVMTHMNTTGAADPTGGDTSADTQSFDGIVPQLFAGGSGAYLKRVNNPLSAAVGKHIPEIKEALIDIYDRTKVVPDRMLVGSQEQEVIDEKIAAVTGDRININVSTGDGGVKFETQKWYPAPVGQQSKQIMIEENPNLPGGMILFLIDSVPYQDSEIPAAWQMHMGRDSARLDYALTKPAVEFEVRFYGALAGYAPGLQGALYDIHRF